MILQRETRRDDFFTRYVTRRGARSRDQRGFPLHWRQTYRDPRFAVSAFCPTAASSSSAMLASPDASASTVSRPSGAFSTRFTFFGAHVDSAGTTTLVGERPYRGTAARSVPGTTAGVVTQFAGDRVTVVSDAINTTRLRAITRLASGVLVACGDWGALVRIELGVVEHLGSICGGHLTSFAPNADGDALTVGVGGHALSLSPKLDAQLEAVQTTRDIISLATVDDGQAWAGSAQARLLRRTNTPSRPILARVGRPCRGSGRSSSRSPRSYTSRSRSRLQSRCDGSVNLSSRASPRALTRAKAAGELRACRAVVHPWR